MKRNIEVSHVDTCVVDFLQDHHNRDGEKLLGIPVMAETTYRELRDELTSEMLSYGFPLNDLAQAIEAMFEHVRDMDAPFDTMLPTARECGSGEAEIPCAWFLVTWGE